MEIQDVIYQFIKTEFDIEDDDPDFTMDVHLFDYGIVDSLRAVEIISFVEEKWNIEITQQDITLYPMNTVNEIARIVREKLANG